MNETQTGNSVRLHPDGYIEVVLVGDQTNKTIADSGRECQRLAEILRARGQRVLALIDFSGEQQFSTGANKATLDVMSQIDYDRVALFGTSKVLADVVDLIVKAIGKGEQTKVFATREEAAPWLLMRDPLGR